MMSSLWETDATNQIITERKRPSPKNNCSAHSLAQDDIPLKNCISSRNPIERISLFIFRKLRGGMTVEAAVILPLLLFFFLNLMSAVEMIRLHGNLELALRDTGNRLAVYGFEYDNIKQDKFDDSLAAELGGIAFSYLFVKNQVIHYLGKDYLEHSPLTYGVDGLNFLESRFFENGDTIDLTVTYQVSPEAAIPGFPPFRMANRYYGRAWTGYDVCPGNGQLPADMVYVAENGTVYHETPDCSYLRLRVSGVSAGEARFLTNAAGERYTECWRCRDAAKSGIVYVTRDGQRFHYDGQCPGLKRTVYTIMRSQAEHYRPCSRCAG